MPHISVGRMVGYALTLTSLAVFVCGQTHDTPRGANGRCGLSMTVPWNERVGGSSWSCGTEGYTRVFTGTVKSTTDVSDTEKRLEIIPDESFLGDTRELTASVTEACLSDSALQIKAGDKWLFYVRPSKYWDKTLLVETDGFEAPWDSPIKPVSEAEDDVATLRRLSGLTDKGILVGNVFRIGPTIETLNPTAVPNHKVVAKDSHSGTEYTAFTNVNGRFELELPPGSYDVTASTKQGLREAESFILNPIGVENDFVGNVYVTAGGCTETALRLLVDGKLAGRVTTAEGRPASFAKVAIIPISPVYPQFTIVADENGYFEVSGRQPGQYLVGVGLLAPFDSAEWQSRVYYPGVRTREQAKVVELDVGEWRTDIDFSVLPTK